MKRFIPLVVVSLAIAVIFGVEVHSSSLSASTQPNPPMSVSAPVPVCAVPSTPPPAVDQEKPQDVLKTPEVQEPQSDSTTTEVLNNNTKPKQVDKEKTIIVNKKIVYLTFDDGPDPIITPRILDTLNSEGVKATFFMQGKCVTAYPDIASKVAKEGHMIGNHTYSHLNPATCTLNTFESEVNNTSQAIQKTTGCTPELFRAPGGQSLSQGKKGFLFEKGYRIYNWNIDSNDSKRAYVPPDEIVRNVAEALEEKNVIIILMHDGANHFTTATALPTVIKLIKEKGYELQLLTHESDTSELDSYVEIK